MATPKETPPSYEEAVTYQQPPPAGWAPEVATAPPGEAKMVNVHIPPSSFQPSVVHVAQPTPAVGSHVVVVGGNCPNCRVGMMQDSPSVLGIICCICLFPIGILFLLLLRKRKCSNCGFSFGD
ncbi:membrane protein BRI3-like isoform X2 [Oratosquilla oratoria]